MIGDSYDLRTPEQIDLQYDLAGLGSRGLAMLIDGLIQLVAIVALAMVFGMGTAVLARYFFPENTDVLVPVGVGIGLLLIFAIFWGYFIFFELTWNGQSPGKRVAGVRVLTVRGEPVTLVHSLVRNIVRLVDLLPSGYMAGAISVLLTRRSQRLGDLAAGTVVVRERREELPRTLPPIDPSLALPPWVASAFTAEDVALAREFLLRAPELSDLRRYELGERLCQTYRARLAEAGHTPPPGLSNEALMAGVAIAHG
ncbi:MAG: RDD family protein [Chloroflexi bacterium]|nr:RDD family protein [Chloroflexota bacterium]